MPLTRREKELREQARALIADGQLPAIRSGRCWGSKGNGKGCSLCGEPVGREEVEFEIEDGGRVYAFHFDCHAAWQLECARAE